MYLVSVYIPLEHQLRLPTNSYHASAQENFHTPYESGNEGCNPTLSLITFSWACDICYFRTNFLTSRFPFLLTFRIKSFLRS